MQTELRLQTPNRDARRARYQTLRWSALAALAIGVGAALAFPRLMPHPSPAPGDRVGAPTRPAQMASSDTSVPDASVALRGRPESDAEVPPTF